MTAQATKEIALTDVIFRDDLYPRLETDYRTVQKYAEDLDVLPPIEVNQRNELIDGWHRWTAFKKNGSSTIPVIVTETRSDAHLQELAIERNSRHGLQLSQEDKKNMARAIYHATPEREREAKKKHLAAILSVGERTIQGWLSRIDKDAKEARDKRIFDMWLACHTQEDIAEAVGLTDRGVAKIITKQTAELPKVRKPHADHLVEFTPPLYNVWKWQNKSEGSTHYGNTEATILDNLLYLYTKPFDLVVDPFAGGGPTIDICKKRFRRYWVGDRLPIPERKKEIRQWDICEGLPPVPRWKDVRLVYLDPPYWKQAEGKYSDDPTDLGNMPLEQFTATLVTLIAKFAKKLHAGGYIALILQPTQWREPNKRYVDHPADVIRAIPLPINMRIQCPYESQQATPQMVEWAKTNKKLLVLSRELVIWEIPSA